MKWRRRRLAQTVFEHRREIFTLVTDSQLECMLAGPIIVLFRIHPLRTLVLPCSQSQHPGKLVAADGNRNYERFRVFSADSPFVFHQDLILAPVKTDHVVFLLHHAVDALLDHCCQRIPFKFTRVIKARFNFSCRCFRSLPVDFPCLSPCVLFEHEYPTVIRSEVTLYRLVDVPSRAQIVPCRNVS